MIYRPYPHRKVVGPYEYFENQVLGQGSSSIAYQGRRVSNQQKVCIKHIHINSTMVQNFAKIEIEVLKRVTHHNVLQFLASYERGTSVYIITEACESTLMETLRKDRKRDPKIVLGTFLQILEGYEALRNRGYIHRDLKPDNIFIKDGQVKLADFGYCALLGRNRIEGEINLGTPAYMAPEALLHSVYSEQSDIWSLGVTLYQMLTGKVPFSSTAEQELKEELTRPMRNLDVGRSCLNSILSRCLSYNPEERYYLQRLLLDVKLAINEIEQGQRRRDSISAIENIVLICSNELHYIRFMDYVKSLAKNTKELKSELRDRLCFLFQFAIRLRIDIVNTFLGKKRDRVPQRMMEDIEKAIMEHSFEFEAPSGLEPHDRLHFFSRKTQKTPRSLHWQSQAVLKDIISSVFSSSIGKLQNDLSVALDESKIKLADFLLTAFLLNKMLIQTDNDLSTFSKTSNLKTIMSAPCRVNHKTWQKIMKKAMGMGMI